MKRHQHVTAFYLETLLLIAVFISIILVLTRVFGLGQSQSGQAKLLTNAVCLAQNAAEAVSASRDGDDLLAILNENGNAVRTDTGVLARYDRNMAPDPEGELRVDVTWTPENGDPTLVRSGVSVLRGEGTDPVYTLDTAVYLGEVEG